jgi:hypothetical protein
MKVAFGIKAHSGWAARFWCKPDKGQFDTSGITSPGAMIPQVWEAVLAA